MSLLPSIINNGESSSAIIRGSSSGGNHAAGKKAATTRQRGNKSKQEYDTCSTSIPLLYQRSSVQGIFRRK